MIQITQVIDYLRTSLPMLRFDGSAELANAKDDSRLMVGSNGEFITTLYVTLDSFIAQTVALETFEQNYEEQFSLIAVLDNKNDRTGKSAQQLVYSIRRALFSVLLNYEGFDLDSHSIQYVGDKFISMDRPRYWHRFTFKILGRLLPEDGKQLTLDELNEIFITYHTSDPIADDPLAQDDLKPLYEIP